MVQPTNTLLITIVAVCLLLNACSAPIKKPDQAGFLSDYSKLEEVADNHLLYSGHKVPQYTRFIIDRPVVLYQSGEEGDEFTSEEIEQLKDYFVDTLIAELTRGDNGYEITRDTGPRTARFRIAITDLDASDGVLNLTIYTKITGAGLGGIAAEGELVDSQTGEQLAAAVRWGSGSRILRAGLTRLGDAKIQIKRWCRDIRRRLDGGRTP